MGSFKVILDYRTTPECLMIWEIHLHLIALRITARDPLAIISIKFESLRHTIWRIMSGYLLTDATMTVIMIWPWMIPWEWIVEVSMQNRHMDQLLDLLEENRSPITIIYSITNIQPKFNFHLINSPLCAKLCDIIGRWFVTYRSAQIENQKLRKKYLRTVRN